jgi:hypothetical protein
MADFRKLLLALIAGALLFGTVASAQSFSCAVGATPTIVRSEAVADMVGDIYLQCSGVIDQLAADDALVANVRVTFSSGVLVTSKVLSGTSYPKVSEGTLILDRALWADNTRHVKGYRSTNPFLPFQDGSQNIYQALQLSDTELEWQGVILVGPGSARAPSYYVTRDIILTNVRVNAQALAAGAPVVATVNITSPTSIPFFTSNTPTVANIRQGLIPTYSGKTLSNCDLAPNGTTAFTATFTEGFGTAFKPRVNTRSGSTSHFIAGASFADESGFNPLGLLGEAGAPASLDVASVLVAADQIGLASQGTQIQLAITDVPNGITLTSAGVTDSLGLVLGTPTRTASGTTTTFVWEVTGYSSVSGQYPAENELDAVTVTITASYGAPPVVGTARAHARFVPASAHSVAQLESVAKVPRFVDSAAAYDANVLVITQTCKTMLLFPYITTTAGYATGVAITNTSVDPLGETIVTGEVGLPTYPATKPQAGACTMFFYGQSNSLALTTAQHKQTTAEIPAGGQFLFSVGNNGNVYAQNGSKTAVALPAMPSFVGYMIAVCNFQWGHGYAFVTDTGSDRTNGYLALVIPDRGASIGRLPQESSLDAAANQAEQLGN